MPSSIFLLTVYICLSFFSHVTFGAFEIDGLALGEMPCDQAIKKIFKRSVEGCDIYKEDRDTSSAVADRSRTTKELCEDVVHVQEEVALDSFKQFKPTTPLGSLCARPSHQVDERFLDAYGLTGAGSVDFSEFRYKGCPFLKFFITADQRPSEASPNRIACDEKKVVFYSKEVTAPFEKIKKALQKKYGKPLKHWGHWKSNGSENNELYQVNLEYASKGIHILLVNIATPDPKNFDLIGLNKASQRKPLSDDHLQFRSQSVVFYFTDSYLKTHQKNFKFLDEYRAGEEEKSKHEMELKEKSVLDQL